MQIIKKILICACVIAALWGIYFSYNRLSDGFSVKQITTNLPLTLETPSISAEKRELLATILNQPFHYLGKGCQFYVFESKDQKYVIKFLKQKHLKQSFWTNHQRRQDRAERLMKSCQIASERMSDETGLVFVHLNHAPHLHQRVTIIDKLGIVHALNIDDYEYLIQQRGVILADFFQQFDPKEIEEKIGQLLRLVRSRCQKGIGDRDRSFAKNIAFLEEEGKAIFIDVGQLYEDPSLLDTQNQREEIKKRLNDLIQWVETHYPEQVSLVEVKSIS